MTANKKLMNGFCSCTLALGLALTCEVTAQSDLLQDMPAVRGIRVYGQGGISGSFPVVSPVVGELGSGSAFADLNHDGYDDLITGAPSLPTAPLSGTLDEAGRVYVLFGGPTNGLPGSTPTFDFSNFSAGQAIEFVGDPGDRLGSAVSAAGDVDGDGIDDVVIGAPSHTFLGRQAAGGGYVLFGSANFDDLPKKVKLSDLVGDPGNWAVFFEGAREFALVGTSVSGDVDANGDGLSDIILGAPLDSTNGLMQNGTATVVYGQAGYRSMSVVDLANLPVGLSTVVHGGNSLQFLGFSVAGLGRFDPVLPMTNNVVSGLLGDEFAIGAPGTTAAGAFFAGAVYVLRGVASGTPASNYTTAQFGNGPNRAGVIFTGVAAGDQVGFFVRNAGDLYESSSGYEELAIGAPYGDGGGKTDCGSLYIVPGSIAGGMPQGFGLEELESPASQLGIHIQGATTGNGLHGVFITGAGDWNGDEVPDVLVGFPNAPRIQGQTVFVGAGVAEILDGQLLAQAGGTVSLGMSATPYSLALFRGENTADHAGAGVAVGDMNGDGATDLSIGSPGAASPPDPFDFTGIGRSETGRSHVVYGPLLRLTAIAPVVTHHGGPVVTLQALQVPVSGIQVFVAGQAANVTQVIPGVAGSIAFAPPAISVPAQFVDVHLETSIGDVTYSNALTYSPLSITSGPSPPTGFEFTTTSFLGTGFSTVQDTTVTIGGFNALVLSVNGLAGTMTVQLPEGPPGGVPLDISITNSNGTANLVDALSYLSVVVAAVNPSQGLQTSGIFQAGALPYPGQPAIPVAVTIQTAGLGGPPPGTLIEFGNATVGYRSAPVTAINGDIVTVNLPYFLLEEQTTVDVRVTLPPNNEVGTLPNSFVYLASDFKELPGFAKPGIGQVAPAALMAGSFSNGGTVLFLLDHLAGSQSLGAVMFLGVALAVPPLPLHGGLFGINLATPVFSFNLPGGFPKVFISQNMPTNMSPTVDGLPLFIQVLTKESNGVITEFGLSNVLLMRINSAP
ncbi:MAG: hypothetical protein ACT4PU_00290 [Planctomycetota bacterium]